MLPCAYAILHIGLLMKLYLELFFLLFEPGIAGGTPYLVVAHMSRIS
jgi:hypothetical protein